MAGLVGFEFRSNKTFINNYLIPFKRVRIVLRVWGVWLIVAYHCKRRDLSGTLQQCWIILSKRRKISVIALAW